jgi:transcriptional regulator with XRE-family HTH domain
MQRMNKTAGLAPNEQLRQQREKRGWSRAYIAEQIGVADPKTIGRWERGGASPSAYFLQRLCTLFQMEASALGLWQPGVSQPTSARLAVTAPASPSMHAPLAHLARIDPALPPAHADGLVGRERLLRTLRRQVLAQQGYATVALSGLPGAGKTALALELAHDEEMRHAFPDGMLWVSLGPDPDIVGELERWGRLLGIEEQERSYGSNREAWTRLLHERLATRRLLLIVDDAWTSQDALAFQLGGQGCAYLLTTRLPAVALDFTGNSTAIYPVPVLEEDASLELLGRFVPTIVADEPDTMRNLVRLTGGLPLALQLIGKHLQAQMYSGQPRRWRDALGRLQLLETRLQLTAPRAPLEIQMGLPVDAPLSLQTAIQLSYQRLSSAAQQALLTLATGLHTPGNFSEKAALRFASVSLTTLDSLLDTGLLASAGPGRYTLHQTIIDFARFQSQQQREISGQFQHPVHFAAQLDPVYLSGTGTI